MDFLDPKKQRRHAALLYLGYVFIAIAVLISTVVLVYQANGFGVDKDGKVVQNGLVFLSSQPNPADIYLNGAKNEAQTNSRLSTPAGDYEVRLAREGYQDWTRNVSVLGGDVQNFDYPFLIPKNLRATGVDKLSTTAGLVSQSRDRKWLVAQSTSDRSSFRLFDLEQDELEPTTIALPAGIASPANGADTWEAVQWANDNQHLLMKHGYGSGTEYLILDRTDPQDSINLNKTLGVNPAKLTLIDNKFDLYHVLIDGQLSRIKLGDSNLQPLLKNVLDYKSFADDRVLYATPSPAGAELVNIAMAVGDREQTIRQINKSDTYTLDIADYRGDQYVVLGGSSNDQVYIYMNPYEQLKESSVTSPEALRALRVKGATFVSFSPNTQYIVAQNGSTGFGVYDIYLKKAYNYTLDSAMDAPQKHAEWMDSNHLSYVSAGKQIMFDFDSFNYQTLTAARPTEGGLFSPNYNYMFAIDAAGVNLTRTPLRTSADL